MKISYITYNEPINGVYISQVIEVVNHFNEIGIPTRIIAIFSLRSFIKDRRDLKRQIPDAITLPAIGKLKYWKQNKLWFKILKRTLSNQIVICRGPLAANLAIDNLKNSKIIYDGRGAVWAEHQEYNVYEGTGIEDQLFEIEKNAVRFSDKQIAISSQLVSYWKKYFQYEKKSSAVIPCTICPGKNVEAIRIPISITNFLNLHINNIIVVFSGGNGKWQQIEKICLVAGKMIKNQPNIAFIFLTSQNSAIDELQIQFPKNIWQTLVTPDQVSPILNRCDYGIVLRENNITNNVASPVKIAEYLAAGLKIIISPNIGDYSKLIEENGLGITVNYSQTPEISKPSQKDKDTAKEFVANNLTKRSVKYKEFLFD